MRGWGIGSGIHIVNARVRAREGAVMNKKIEEVIGLRGSLMNSFMASANGWSRP